MRLILYPALILASALLFFAACRHQDGPQPAAGNPSTPTNPNNPDNPGNTEDTALCFSRDILPIFVSNCAKSGCHDAASHKDGYVFTSYQTITSKKFKAGDAEDCKLYEAITEDEPDEIMPPPPAAPLTAAQIALIGRWINTGALDRGPCAAPCDSAQFRFSANIQPLLGKYCTGCHSGASASGGVRLDSHAAVQSVALGGRLVGAISHSTGYSPMPKGGTKLSDCQIAQIRKWVQAGALND